MIITAIEPKRKGLSALYIDGEFILKLDSETLIVNSFNVGKEIDEDDLVMIKELSDKKRCKEKALWLIQYRDHTRKELFDKLKKDYPEEICDEVCERFIELGLINDRNYASRYASDLINLKKLSKKGAKRKMIEKGIDRDLIDEVLDEIEIDEDDMIKQIIQRKYLNGLDTDKGKQKAINGLMRMGYAYSDIKSALYEILDDFEEY